MGSEIPTVSNGCSSEKTVSRRTYQVVVAATREGGLGIDGRMAWDIPTDTKFFHDVTTKTSNPEKMNAVIMGRKSWYSVPPEERPHCGRLNVIVTRSPNFDIGGLENVLVCGSLDSALEILASPPYDDLIETVFNIGGGILLRDTLNAPACDAIHITEMETSIECDAFIPSIDMSLFHPWYSSFPLIENNIRYSFVTYVRVRSNAAENGTPNNSCKSCSGIFEVQNFSFLPQMIRDRHEEYTYLGLVQDIFSSDNFNYRTRIGTLSKFGCQMRFNLRKTFPLLTTKRLFWQGVVEELLWFISGSTDAKVLQEKGMDIWDGFTSRNHIDSIGLTDREEGDLGPVHGFQWRHFGARYIGMHADYTGQGIDQLLDVIHKIKNSPDDRRIILSSWNPSDLTKTALPPSHMFAQFYVANGELSCLMYQPSADMGLGVPFDIASYALLTCLIAHVCDLLPGDLIHDIGVAHVDHNHFEPFQEQLRNMPKPFPVLKINSQKKSIDSFVPADFNLIGYHPHKQIEMKMAV
ncbi:putative bifunctional dihydrofolate reductase-thymidylate synthase [Silene latifolia]|uniref:putative bifunctional dihydrofolate reductase-thymidylate synthase n=1 Tax=Silene latifolia TaxID=37657 RepID=UPI003D77B98B